MGALLAMSVLLGLPTAAAAADGCPATPREAVLPGVVAEMAGESPVWLVDGSAGVWTSPEAPVKTLWVLAREGAGGLRAVGRAAGGGSLLFRAGREGPDLQELRVDDPWRLSVAPGGAPADVLARFAFVPSYVVYPRPGCWRLEVTLGSERREVVVEVRAAQPGSQPSAGASLSPGSSEGQREMNQAP